MNTPLTTLTADGHTLSTGGVRQVVSDSYAYVPPAPLLRYVASSLSTLSTGATVPTWANTGSLGSAFDATPTSAGAATYTAPAGSDPAYLRFASPEHLVTTPILPGSLSGSSARTLLIRYYLEGSGNVSLVGTGETTNGHLFDVMSFNGILLTPHLYAGQVSGAAYPIGAYATVVLRAMTQPGGGNQLDVLQDGAYTPPQGIDTTTASQFHLGGGVFAPYNNNTPRRLVGVAFYADALTNAQITDALATLY